MKATQFNGTDEVFFSIDTVNGYYKLNTVKPTYFKKERVFVRECEEFIIPIPILSITCKWSDNFIRRERPCSEKFIIVSPAPSEEVNHRVAFAPNVS